MLSRRFLALVLAPAAMVLVASLVTSKTNAAPQQHCPEGIKLGAGVTEYCTDGAIITGVCIKAGTQLLSFNADTDGKESCYSIKGIGTTCVSVSGGGTGRDCKEISGITVYADDKKEDDK